MSFPKIASQLHLLILNDGKLYGALVDAVDDYDPLIYTPLTIPLTNVGAGLGASSKLPYQPSKLIATIISFNERMYLTTLLYLHEGPVPENWGLYEGKLNDVVNFQAHYGQPITISIGSPNFYKL